MKKGHLDYIKDFEFYLLSNGFSKITIKNYSSDLKKFFAWKGKDPFFKTDLENYRRFLSSTNVAYATEKRIISTVSKFGQYLNSNDPTLSLSGIARPFVAEPVHGMNKSKDYLESQGIKTSFSKLEVPKISSMTYLVIAFIITGFSIGAFVINFGAGLQSRNTSISSPKVLGGESSASAIDVPNASTETDNKSNSDKLTFLTDYFKIIDARKKENVSFEDKYAKYGLSQLLLDAELDVTEDAYFHKKVNIENDLVIEGDILGRGGLELSGDANFLGDLVISGPITLSGLTPSSGIYTDSDSSLTTVAPTSGILGFWERVGGFISPATSTDVLRLSAFTSNTNGILYISNSNGDVAATTPGTAGVLCLTSTNGSVPTWVLCSTGSVTGTGSANQVSYWASSTGQSGSDNFWFDGTNVGIGTTAPSYQLDVSGTGRFTGDLRLGGAFYDASASAGSSTNILTSTGTGTSWQTITSAISSTAFIQNGNSFTANAVLGTNDAYSLSLETNGVSKLYIDTTGNIGIGGTAPSTLPSMYVGDNGNVGIGTTAPGYKLDVNGDIRIASGSELYSNGSATLGLRTYTTPSYVANGQTFTASIQALDDAVEGVVAGTVGVWTLNSGKLYPTTISNTVGLGTTAPLGRLNIQGVGTTTGFSLLTQDSTGAHKFAVLDNGNVGIGTTAPAYKLDVSGTASVWNLISQNIILSSLSTSIMTALYGHDGYTNFTGGIGTGGNGKNSVTGAQRITSAGNLVNIGSIQAGQTLLTSAGTFSAKVDYITASSPESVAIGDLNGDGKADLVTANVGSNSVSVFINNGDGTYATKADYTTGSQPRAVAIGDLNGDGKADLAAANGASTSVSVFINNGAGTFATKVDYTTQSNPRGVSIGDLNGDGKADLVVVNNGSTSVSVLMNNGAGTFATKVDYTTGSQPRAVAIGDLNGDSKADLAVASNGSDRASVLMNNGTGTFASKVDYVTGSSPYHIAMGDISGDGKADLVTSNSGTNNISVFINNGAGTFATKVDYPLDSSPVAVAIGDLNGDGNNDLAVANNGSDTAWIFMNNGTGIFSAGVGYVVGAGPNSIAIGDLNGDGKADLVTADVSINRVSVLLNQPQPMFFAQASTGNVGIGTTAPAGMLAVGSSSQFNVTSTGAVTGASFTDGTSTLTGGNLTALTSAQFGTGNLYLTGTTVGLSTDTDLLSLSANALTVNGTATIGTLNAGATDTVVTHSSGTLQTRTIDSRVWGSSLTDGSGSANQISYWSDANTLTGSNNLWFDGAKVGIGTTAPTALLSLYIPMGSPETPLATVSTNSLSAGANDYNMGYKFTANADGQVTKLWIRYGDTGLHTVRLYDSGGNVLASADITGVVNTWVSADITPVDVTSGNWYVVAVRANGVSNAYIFETLATPITTGNITIEDSRYIAASDSMPTTVNTTTMFGQADITFVQGSGIGSLLYAQGSSSSLYVKNNGYVGIGTTAPSYQLDVTGTARLTGDLRLSGAFYDTSASAGSNTNILTSTGTGTSWSSITSAISSTAFIQNGNSFTADAVLGTNDAYSLSLETNGTSKLYIDTTGNIGIGGTAPSTVPGMYVGANGNVGIGTTAPADKLEIATTANVANNLNLTLNGAYSSGETTPGDITSIKMQILGTTVGQISSTEMASDRYALQFKTGNFSGGDNLATRMTILGTGNVGIGTTAPGQKLSVNGDIGVPSGNYLNFSYSDAANANSIRRDANTGSMEYNSPADHVFNTGGTPKVTILSSGNVGIGTTAPASALEIGGSGNLRIGGLTASMGVYTDVNKQLTSTAPTSGALGYWQRNGTDLSPATISDNVGIGTTAPLSKLTVAGSIFPSVDDTYDLGSNTYRWQDIYLGPATMHIGTSTSDEGTLTYDTGNNTLQLNAGAATPSFVITSAGNVGIGTTGPVSKLTIFGSTTEPSLTHNTAANFDIKGWANGTDLAFGSSGNSPYAAWIQNRHDVNDGTAYPITLNPLGGTVGIGYENPGTTATLAINGNVGIGTTGPGFPLEVNGAIVSKTAAGTAATLSVWQNTMNKWDFASPANSYDLQIQENGTPRITVLTSSGNVGIGTTAPGSLLHINGADPILTIQDTETSATLTNSTLRLAESSAGGALDNYYDINLGVNGKLSFIDNYSDAGGTGTRLVIDGSGNVGIGTTAPLGSLDVTRTFTDPTATFSSIVTDSEVNITSNNAQTFQGIRGIAQTNAESGTGFTFTGTSAFRGIVGRVTNRGTDTITGGIAALYNITNTSTGTITNAYGSGILNATNSGGGTITSLSGIAISDQTSGSTGNTNLLIGGGTTSILATTPAGNFSIYNSSSYNNYFAGNVGIGTTAPGANLEISDNPGAVLRISNTDTAMIAGDVAGQIDFYKADTSTGGAGVVSTIKSRSYDLGGAFDLDFITGSVSTPVTAMTMRFDGFVGIGTTNPGSKLTVAGGSAQFTGSSAPSSGIGVEIGYNGTYGDILSYNRTTPGYKGLNLNDTMYVTGGSTGNVGIGTTAPGAKLDISGAVTSSFTNNPHMLLMQSTNAQAANMGAGLMLGGTYVNANAAQTAFGYIAGLKENGTSGNYAGKLVFGTRTHGSGSADMTRMVIDSTGNVGIGTTAPVARLALQGAGTTTGISLLTQNSSGVAKFAVLDNGNVGIGTTAPGVSLDILSPATTSNQIRLNTTTSGYNSSILFRSGSSDRGTIWGDGDAANGAFNIGTSSFGAYLTVGMGSNYLGRVGIGTTTPLSRLTVQGAGTTTGFSFLTQNNSAAHKFAILDNGNVGIGTTAPSGLFDVYASSQTTMTKESLTAGMLSQSGLSSFTAANLIDGDVYTQAFHTDTAAVGSYLAIDFGVGVTKDIVQARIKSVSALTAIWSVEYSDNGSAWSTATTGFNVSEGYQWHTKSWTSVGSHRYWRFYKTNAASSGGWHAELELYSTSSTAGSAFMVTTAGKVGIGTTSPAEKLHVLGNVRSTGFITNGADYAEYFETKDTDLTAGEAVCVDVLNPNSVVRCSRESDSNIMGIVSTNPAFLGNSSKDKENNPKYKAIAMLGQIPAKVSNENGQVRIGDSLTSASIPGYVMKANAGDSTVGVALENLDVAKERGTIQVMISRRNKSMTVEAVEAKVTERIAAMKIEDEVNVLVANAVANLTPKNTLTLDENGNVILASNPTQSIDLLANNQSLITLQSDYESLKNSLTSRISDIENSISSSLFEKEYDAGSDVLENTIVSYDGSGVTLANSDSRDNIIGVATVVDSESSKATVVTRGRVVITVTNENGNVYKNDPITVSSGNNGLGVKAITEGMIIGYALNDAEYDDENQSSIEIAISPSWFTNSNSDLALGSNSVDLSGSTSLTDLTISGDSLLYGNLSVMGDSRFTNIMATGDLTVGLMTLSSESNSINVAGDVLKLQNEYGAGDIEAFGGKIVMTNTGDVKVFGEVTASKYNVDTSDVAGASAGKVTILSGSSEVVVETTALTPESLIFVTAENSTSIFTYEVVQNSIRIYTDTPVEKDTLVNWWIVN